MRATTHLHILRRGAALATVAALLAGCASSQKPTSTTAPAKAAGSDASQTMTGMSMGAGSTGAQSSSVAGIKPVPTQVLGSATWEQMKISARAMTAVPFIIYDGASSRIVKPARHTSFHLMVMLSDAQTGVAIPYASVWATIRKAGRVVYDERQWPMISRYMGPHYGNDVSVPGAGVYQLSLLVSPPVSARHMEYAHVWTRPHRVSLTFHWKPTG